MNTQEATKIATETIRLVREHTNVVMLPILVVEQLIAVSQTSPIQTQPKFKVGDRVVRVFAPDEVVGTVREVVRGTGYYITWDKQTTGLTFACGTMAYFDTDLLPAGNKQ